MMEKEKKCKAGLLHGVNAAWIAFPAERMEKCVRCLIASYHGTLESGGGNDYNAHRGGRKSAREGVNVFFVTIEVVEHAEHTLEQLKQQLQTYEEALEKHIAGLETNAQDHPASEWGAVPSQGDSGCSSDSEEPARGGL